jgi:CBS domain-containing protein
MPMDGSSAPAPTDPVGFVRALEPFRALGPLHRALLARELEVVFVPAGSRLLSHGGDPATHLHVVRKGTALLSRDGAPVLTAEAGEWFALPSVLDAAPPAFDVDALDDLLLYRLPRAAVRQLTTDATFAAHVAAGLAARLRATGLGPSNDGLGAVTTVKGLQRPVGDLCGRGLVTVPRSADVREVAARMRAGRVTSVVLDGQPAAILTDRDLRDRVLAEGHGPDTPAEKVASHPIVSVPAETPVADAQVAMLDRGIHHLGVERDGRLVGIVTTGDLLRHHATSPLHAQRWLGTVERAELARAIDELHAVIGVLVAGGLGPLETTRTVSSLTDTLTRRVIELVGADLGPAPGPYAWLALGSDARREQTLHSDQDHALVHAEVADDDAVWFHELAAGVTDLLEVAGLPRCPGGTMATRWCDPLPVWQRRFERWLAEPDVQALYETGIFLDHRVVAGDLDVGALDAIVRSRRRDAVLLARLASAASTARPPVGLFHRLREDHEGRVDLKAGGLVPIADLARVLAVEVGSDARSTVERLAAAREAGVLSEEGADELTEAFGFLLGLRLRAQVTAHATGTAATTLVRVDDLAPSARRHLKEAFVAIARVQEVTVQRLGGSEVAR